MILTFCKRGCSCYLSNLYVICNGQDAIDSAQMLLPEQGAA